MYERYGLRMRIRICVRACINESQKRENKFNEAFTSDFNRFSDRPITANSLITEKDRQSETAIERLVFVYACMRACVCVHRQRERERENC